MLESPRHTDGFDLDGSPIVGNPPVGHIPGMIEAGNLPDKAHELDNHLRELNNGNLPHEIPKAHRIKIPVFSGNGVKILVGTGIAFGAAALVIYEVTKKLLEAKEKKHKG